MSRLWHAFGQAAALSALLIVLVSLPTIVESRYVIHIFIATGIYTALALGYDLIVGQVGLLSLAHPAFVGVGAYLAGILATRFGTPFLASMTLGGVVAGSLALIVSFPFFRLAGAFFAISTLGFTLIVQLIAMNSISLTGGPLCLMGVPRPSLIIPPLINWRLTSTTDFYYLILGMLCVVVAIYWRITRSRLGRTLNSIREDEVLAMAAGVNPLHYKTFVFVVGALIAGSVGAYTAYYTTVVCPGDISNYMTTILVIILFLGGVGRMRGVILGGIIFTFLPEVLRITSTWRMVIYGVLLLAAIVYMPEGLDGVLATWLRRVPAPGGQANGKRA